MAPHDIEIIHVGAMAVTPLKRISKDGSIEYGPIELADCDEAYFQCTECGKEIRGNDGNLIRYEDELIEYLAACRNKKNK